MNKQNEKVNDYVNKMNELFGFLIKEKDKEKYNSLSSEHKLHLLYDMINKQRENYLNSKEFLDQIKNKIDELEK